MDPQNEQMLLNYMMQQGGNNAADQSIARKQALVNQLRQTSQMPDMIQGGGARTVRAASPLSAIGNIAGNVMAGIGQRDVNTQQANVMGDRRSQLADLAEQQRQAQQNALPLQQRQGYQPPPVTPDPYLQPQAGMGGPT
jgi:hypothetical protein